MKPLNFKPYKTDYFGMAKELVFKYINTSLYKVFVYGSRARNTHHRFSDLDIGVIGEKPLAAHVHLELEHKLDESRIPFKVEIVDFSIADENFKKEAMQNVVWWN